MHEVASQLSGAILNAEYNKLAGEDHMPNPKVMLQILSNILNQ